MIRVYVFRGSDHPNLCGISELYSVVNKALAPGRKAGIDYKFTLTESGWLYWYEFETEEEAALFKLTYL